MSITTYYILLFFFNATATTQIYTLSLHDALPISLFVKPEQHVRHQTQPVHALLGPIPHFGQRFLTLPRSEEHTSELQSRQYLVCRLLLEKKKQTHDRGCTRLCQKTPTVHRRLAYF